MREYMEKSVFVSPNCCIIIDGALVIKQKTMPYKSPLAMPIETTFIIVLLIRATVSLKTFSVAGGMYWASLWETEKSKIKAKRPNTKTK